MVAVFPVRSNKDLNRFIKLEWKIYKDDPNWVPPLLSERKKILDKKHPFYKHAEVELFLAEKNGELVGRIAAIKNDLHNKFHKDIVGFFGFFESINNQDVAAALFDAVKNWLRAKNLYVMRGPANPSSNEEFGLLIEGFDSSPTMLMTYNPKYYLELLKNYGFEKAKDLLAYQVDNRKIASSEKLKRIADFAKERWNVKISEIDMKNYYRDIDKIKYIYNKAWQLNWGYVPMTDEEIDLMAKDIKPLIVPEGVLFGEVNGEPIGFVMAVLDYNQLFKNFNGRLFPLNFLKILTQRKKITSGRIITLGIIPEYQRKGLDAAFYWEILSRSYNHGISTGEASWILEDNEMMNSGIRMMGGVVYKKYRIYDLEI